jgi:hypothetical protein
MKHRVPNSPTLIHLVGTQVVALKQQQGSNGESVHPAGTRSTCTHQELGALGSPIERQFIVVREVDGLGRVTQ